MTLVDAIGILRKSLAKANIGWEFEVGLSDEAEAIRKVLPLSDELIEFYRLLPQSDIIIPWSVEVFTLYGSTTVVNHQVGYRWLEKSEPDQLIEVWEASWVVIGDKSADPVIAHSNQLGTPVSIAAHGTGDWAPQVVAPSLSSYLRMLSVWVDIGLVKYDGKVFDEESYFHSEVTRDLREKLSKLVNDEQLSNFLEFLGVWPV